MSTRAKILLLDIGLYLLLVLIYNFAFKPFALQDKEQPFLLELLLYVFLGLLSNRLARKFISQPKFPNSN